MTEGNRNVTISQSNSNISEALPAVPYRHFGTAGSKLINGFCFPYPYELPVRFLMEDLDEKNRRETGAGR